MGRLFWKIFLAILLAQLVTTGAVGILLWKQRPRPVAWQQDEHPAPHDWRHRDRPPHPFNDDHPFPPFDGDPDQQGGHRPHPGPAHGEPGIPYLAMLVGGLASLFFAALLARHLSRPIMALREAFRAVGKGKFDISPSRQIGARHDELAELGREFEHTAHQLKQLMGSQRRLLHDVSHEIRSPLARMQLAIDLARQQPEKIASSMKRIERESGRIDRLVEELLTLSRLEARAYGAMDEALDLRALVEEVISDARFEAQAHRRQIEFACEGEMPFKGRPDLLQRAVENVVRNALRYTFEGTSVHVSLTQEEAWLCLRVEDDGPGLPENTLDSVFEPFVRLREDKGNDGYGLGLAITRETVEAHGGTIRATNRELGGLCMEIRLPAA